jgi:hypothetical protein
VTIARALSDTFAGIRPADVPVSSRRSLPARSRRLCCSGGSCRPCLKRPNASSCRGLEVPSMTTVLFACVHNAGRSQMAAAWFNRLADSSRARALSAARIPDRRCIPKS